MTASAMLRIFFGACVAFAGIRQIGVASSRPFESAAERQGYYSGIVIVLAFAGWLVISGIRSRKGGPSKVGSERP